MPAPPADDKLYQVSVIPFIRQGGFAGLVPVGELKAHGDFGVAVADDIDGELTLLDGRMYQALSDGRVQTARDEMAVPFAMVTRFCPTLELPLGAQPDRRSLQARLDERLESRNVFWAIAVEGLFTRVQNRAFPRQARPYRPQTAIADQERRIEARDVEGTLVGFWSPRLAAGLTAPGYHFHFVSGDGRASGHTLELSLERGVARLAPLSRYEVALPTTADYWTAELSPDQVGEPRRD